MLFGGNAAADVGFEISLGQRLNIATGILKQICLFESRLNRIEMVCVFRSRRTDDVVFEWEIEHTRIAF